MSPEIKLKPVGGIEVEEGRFYLSIRKKYRTALNELEGFSHINIIWWGNQSDSLESRDILVAKKPYRNGPDTVFIFATRSEARPNPV
jgi:tRNA (adenine37-N6)-methyltransferase